MNKESTFIATAMRGYQGQLLINIPKDTIRLLELNPRDKVLINLTKTGMVSTRKLPKKPFQKKEETAPNLEKEEKVSGNIIKED